MEVSQKSSVEPSRREVPVRIQTFTENGILYERRTKGPAVRRKSEPVPCSICGALVRRGMRYFWVNIHPQWEDFDEQRVARVRANGARVETLYHHEQCFEPHFSLTFVPDSEKGELLSPCGGKGDTDSLPPARKKVPIEVQTFTENGILYERRTYGPVVRKNARKMPEPSCNVCGALVKRGVRYFWINIYPRRRVSVNDGPQGSGMNGGRVETLYHHEQCGSV